MNEIKHYLVYLITNTVNGKIYVGKHETLDPDDDYMIYGWISVERLDILGIMHRVKYPHRSREMKKILQCLFDKDF